MQSTDELLTKRLRELAERSRSRGCWTYSDFLDMAGQSDYLADWKAMVLEELIQSHDEIIAEGNALTLKDLAIGGADLKTLGIQPGPEMGRILNDLLDKVLEDPTLNTKEQLIQVVTSL